MKYCENTNSSVMKIYSIKNSYHTEKKVNFIKSYFTFYTE